MIQVIYKLFLGILLATTAGMGIATFYSASEAPEYPAESITYNEEGRLSEAEHQYQQAATAHAEKQQTYDRNTAIIAILLSLVILTLSLTVLSKVDVIADGLIFGGILTLLYGIGRSFGSEEPRFIFIATLVGLATALVLGYLKFIRPVPVKA
ncbi:MAG TPA: hypothetical protein VK978_00360 [Candidatus Saccharimonadales bacterium]|nr:hypothetical protein [Candidatus Saccharimonadales bacterium]